MKFQEALYMWYWMNDEVTNCCYLPNFPFLFFVDLKWYQYHEDCTHRNVKIIEIPFVVVETFDDMLMVKMWRL